MSAFNASAVSIVKVQGVKNWVPDLLHDIRERWQYLYTVLKSHVVISCGRASASYRPRYRMSAVNKAWKSG